MRNYPGYMVLNKVLQWLWLLLGGINLFLWSLGTLGVAMDLANSGMGAMILALVLMALSAWMVARGLARKRLAKSYRMVTAMLGENPHCTVEEMAAILGMKPAKLRVDLRRLLNHQLLPGYILNASTGTLVLLAHAVPAGMGYGGGQQMRTVYCSSCGATTMVEEGSNARCEYCGSPLDME